MSSSSSSDSDGQDSDSSYDESTRKSRPRKGTKEGPNKYECKGCSKIFRSLASRFIHTSKCEAYQKRKMELTCTRCNKSFPSKKTFGLHAAQIHGDNSHITSDPAPFNNTCDVCKKVFTTNILLKYHIRRTHFNLIGKAPYAQEKKVNQVWFEKVMNSNNIIEIKKIEQNTLVMKRISENTAIKVNNDNERIIDVTDLYPTGRSNTKTKCQYCRKMILRSRYRTHYKEVHLNIRNYHCDTCDKSFKRNYLLMQHPCYKSQKLKDDQEAVNDISNTSIIEPSNA